MSWPSPTCSEPFRVKGGRARWRSSRSRPARSAPPMRSKASREKPRCGPSSPSLASRASAGSRGPARANQRSTRVRTCCCTAAGSSAQSLPRPAARPQLLGWSICALQHGTDRLGFVLPENSDDAWALTVPTDVPAAAERHDQPNAPQPSQQSPAARLAKQTSSPLPSGSNRGAITAPDKEPAGQGTGRSGPNASTVLPASAF